MTFWHQPNGYKGSGYFVQNSLPKLLRTGERGRGSKHYLTRYIFKMYVQKPQNTTLNFTTNVQYFLSAE